MMGCTTKQKRPITFLSGDLALFFILINYKNSSHQRPLFPVVRLSYVGFYSLSFLILAKKKVNKKMIKVSD